MKGLISIFALPYEIEDLHALLINLRRNMAFVKIDMDLHLTFCLSSEMTNWEDSKLPISYFEARFKSLAPLYDWSKDPKIHVERGHDILGCVSHRRKGLQYLDDYDFVTWIDSDIWMGDATLGTIASAVESVKKHNEFFILTPELVRQWDTTWDVLVNHHFIDKPLNYHESADVIQNAVGYYGQPIIKPMSSCKIAGGMCSTFSSKLLKSIGIPESFGHYGLEDTFIAAVVDILRGMPMDNLPTQYRLANLLVSENYKYKTGGYLSTMLASRNRRDEFIKIANAAYSIELPALKKRIHEGAFNLDK